MLEARLARRYDCVKAIDCEIENQVRVVFMSDISMLGAHIEGARLPEVGSLMRVSPVLKPEKQWIFCQVSWVRRGKSEEGGVRFLEPVSRLAKGWVGSLLSGKDCAELRRSVRVPLQVPVEVRLPKGREIETSTLDLGCGGALVNAPLPLRQGQQAEIQIRLPWCHIKSQVEVVRYGGSKASLRFISMSPSHQRFLQCFLKEECRASRG